MKLETYADRDMMMIDLANQLAGDLESCLLHHDTASFVVPGGTTPGPIFDNLCAAALDWDRVHVMLSDERWVPEDSPRSNTGLLRARLFQNRAAEAHYVPLYAEADAPEDALPDLIAAVEREMPISVLLLGMGADMHTASLFPGADNLAAALEPTAPALMAMRAPGAPEPRITLTASVLAGAMTTHVVITGDEKRAALDAAQTLSPQEAPISVVLRNATVHWAP
ncbi:6-phosphogluconolactonase [Shimia ponticola]|uniref:6-phosphogluconolactonase n=1 Tax=Shimia ponticola TaxID=2582893 RepID=UPI0011BDC636|nr:6-phosphogluconolactonase [Shimia ponticola]